MARVRFLVLVAAAAFAAVTAGACGGRHGGDPAWPESAGSMVPDDWKDDGGESLEPDVPAEVAALETTAEVEEETADEVVEAVADEPADATPAAAAAEDAPVETAPDEIFVEEEIIIEIE
jgi:hypothetical protein